MRSLQRTPKKLPKTKEGTDSKPIYNSKLPTMTQGLIQMTRLVLLFATTVHWRSTTAITAYDCSEDKIQYQMIDLLEPAQCNELDWEFEDPDPVEVQVLQMENEKEVIGYQCRASKNVKVHRCAQYTHYSYGNTVVSIDKEVPISVPVCRDLANGLPVTILGRQIKAKMNGIRSDHWSPDDNTGGRDEAHWCTMKTFTEDGTQYHNSHRKIDLRVEVRRLQGQKKDGIVYWENGQTAEYNKAAVSNDYVGLMIWNSTQDGCEAELSELYLGHADLHEHKEQGRDTLEKSIVMIGNNQTSQFAGLLLGTRKTVCGSKYCYNTQIRDLALCDIRRQSPLKTSYSVQQKHRMNDMAAQLGHLFISSRLRTHRNFMEVIQDICDVERKVLHSKLQALATQDNPYALMDIYGPGHTVYVAGALAYVVKCKAVEVQRVEYKNCTEEIPVTYRNRTVFANPFTMVLHKFANEIACSMVYKAGWKLGGVWWCNSPGPQFDKCSQQPEKLNVTTGNKFYAGADFAEGFGKGIYTQGMLDSEEHFRLNYQARKAVISQMTNAAIINSDDDATRGYLGVPIPGDFETFAYRVASVTQPIAAMLGKSTFGFLIFCSFIFGLSWAIGVIYRIIAIYRERGFGWWIMGALCISTFQLCLLPARLVKRTIHEADKEVAALKLGPDYQGDPHAIPEHTEEEDLPFRHPLSTHMERKPNPNVTLDPTGWGEKTPFNDPPGAPEAPYENLQSDLADVRNQQGVLQEQLVALVDAINLQNGIRKQDQDH